MGEWADYYIERQIHRHTNPERHLYQQVKAEQMATYQQMNDQELLASAKEALSVDCVNPKFKGLGARIVQERVSSLSEKQRKCLLGLLNI